MIISKKFLTNGLVLTVVSLFLRWVGLFFNTYISNRLGSEGMGVYTLVQSVFGFAVTFACSGINLGSTRLISDALAKNKGKEAQKAMAICVTYSLLFSLTAMTVVLAGAAFLGQNILGDRRTVKAIRILALSLPFMSLSSVFNGYFSAVRRVYKSATVMILEQFSQITVTVNVLSLFSLKGVEYACMAVAIGTLVSELLSLVYNMTLWFFDARKQKYTSNEINPDLTKKLLGISLPLALSTYIRSGLITVEHLLIPYGLRKNGASYSQSMSLYGLIQGMVFPVIMFPSCLIYSFAGLLIPEFAEYNENKEYDKINSAASKVIKYALWFSIGVAGIIICYSYELSMAFYNSSEAFEYIRLFAPLVTVMYLDGAVDGILKGLNQQLHSMKINIADALLSVLFVYILIPYLGIKGYIIAIFICELFNCTMSLMRLVKISQPYFSVKSFVVKPLFCILAANYAVVFLLDLMNVTFFASKLSLGIRIATTAAIYFVLLFGKKKISHKNKTTPVFLS